MPGINKSKYAEIGRKMRLIPLEKPVSSHEWEELVQRMCDSDDADLHNIGVRELGELVHKKRQQNKR